MLTKQQMIQALRQIAASSRETTARLETFELGRVPIGDLAQIGQTAHLTAQKNASTLEHFAMALEKMWDEDVCS